MDVSDPRITEIKSSNKTRKSSVSISNFWYNMIYYYLLTNDRSLVILRNSIYMYIFFILLISIFHITDANKSLALSHSSLSKIRISWLSIYSPISLLPLVFNVVYRI